MSELTRRGFLGGVLAAGVAPAYAQEITLAFHFSVYRMMDVTQVSHFLSKIVRIPESGCWVWMGKLQGSGYGEFRLTPKADGKYKRVLAHRFSFEAFKGPLGGMKALHTCDVPCCVNPDHLFAGTQLDNIADMMSKGRAGFAKGEFKGASPRKLSAADHAVIAASDERSVKLAAQYGVHYTQINWIKRTKGPRVAALV